MTSSSSSSLPVGARLSAKATLVTLNISAWRTSKANADETRAVNAKHGTRDAARVSVAICDHPALLAAYKLQAEARAEHYALTLPAADKGMRLLPVARQMQHADMLRDYRARIDALVGEFLRDYDSIRAEAPARLNGLYVESQWPDRDTVAAKFGFVVRYLPVPDAGQWQEWMAEAAASAHEDLTERLRSAVVLVAERLAEPKARVFDSLTGNLAELLALVPDLNLTSDPRLAAIAEKAKGLLEHDADTLREDPIARADIAAKANEVAAMFTIN